MKEIFGSPIVFDRAIKGYTYDEMDFPASNFRSPANTIKFNDVKKSREYIKSKKDEKDESENDE